MLSSEAGVAVRQTTTEKMMKVTIDMCLQKKTSEYSKDSGNSRELRSIFEMETGGGRNDFNDEHCDQTLTRASEYSKYSMDSQGKLTAKNSDVQHCSL